MAWPINASLWRYLTVPQKMLRVACGKPAGPLPQGTLSLGGSFFLSRGEL